MTMTTQQTKTPRWLIYFGGWITGFIFLLTEKNDDDVRWHAANAISVFGAIHLLFAVLYRMEWWPFFGFFVRNGLWVVWIVAAVLWLVMMIQSSHGQRVMVPGLSNLAENHISKWFKPA